MQILSRLITFEELRNMDINPDIPTMPSDQDRFYLHCEVYTLMKYLQLVPILLPLIILQEYRDWET